MKNIKIKQNNYIINLSLDEFYIKPFGFNNNIINSDDVNIFTRINNRSQRTIIKDEIVVSTNNNFNSIIFKFIANNEHKQLINVIKSTTNININEQDKDGDTALHIAVFLCNINAIKILLNANANLLIKDKWGQTPLHRICFCLDNIKINILFNIIHKFALKHKLNLLNIQDNYGNTVCHLILKHILQNNPQLYTVYNIFIKQIINLTDIKIKNTDNETIISLVDEIKCLLP